MSVKGHIENYTSRFQRDGDIIGLLFVLPVLLLITGLILYPIYNTFWLSLNRTIAGQEVWVGLGNYVDMVSSEWFFQVMKNTFIWTTVSVFLQVTVGFGIALLLNTQFRGKSFLRGALLLPWVTPTIVVALVFEWMYDPQFGIINHLLLNLGLIQSTVAWLANPDFALFALILAGLWKRFPFVMIMLLAGLQDVDDSLHNAAIIDGAPFHSRLRHVTIPQLLPVLKIVVLLSIIWSFQHFVLIYTTTGGGPAGATNVLAVQVYDFAFSQLQYGMASTLSVVMLLVMIVFMFFYIRALRSQGVEL